MKMSKCRREEKDRHEMVLEMELRSEVKILERYFDSIPTFRADMRASEVMTWHESFNEVKRGQSQILLKIFEDLKMKKRENKDFLLFTLDRISLEIIFSLDRFMFLRLSILFLRL